MVIKLPISIGLHDAYPAIVVNFAFSWKVKMPAACNFISLGKKIIKGKERKKRREEKNY